MKQADINKRKRFIKTGELTSPAERSIVSMVEQPRTRKKEQH